MAKKIRITRLGTNAKKWISVNLPIKGTEETRRYDFLQDKVDGLLEISNNSSALLLSNEKQILINLPHSELRQQFHKASSYPDGIWDLTEVTGILDNTNDLENAFTATLPDNISAKNTPNKELEIIVFAHYRLDENPTAKYCLLSIKWSDIHMVKKSVSSDNTTFIELYKGVTANGIDHSRNEWWFDMPANKFQELVNIAQINGDERLNLLEDTRKRTNKRPPPPPAPPRKIYR